MIKSKAIIGFVLVLGLFGASCTLRTSVTVTIYNNTSIATGTLYLIYGDYQGYADDELYLDDVSFPYTITLDDCTVSRQFIVIARLDHATGASSGVVLIDTALPPDHHAVIDLAPYVVTGTDAYETDDVPGSARPIQGGEFQARTLSSSTDIDYVSFHAYEGRRYYIDTEMPQDYYANYANTVISLQNPSDVSIASGWDHSDRAGQYITWTADYSGACYIRVACQSSDSGSYGLTLYSTSAGNAMTAMRTALYRWKSER